MSALIGKIIQDRYHFIEFIGRGGMADVYKVWDSQRMVHLAAKVLQKDLALDRVFLRRFKREADTLAKLQHPYIVRSYGLEQNDRLAFLLLDFIDGETLKEWIFDANGPMDLKKIKQVVRPVIGALQYAHSMNMAHCDIKPANIMIHNNGTVLLADFGIARMTDAATATLVGIGTPAYMAPEQIKGEDPMPETDIYAMGILLYEMLTGGERPFTGEHATTGSTSEKVRWEHLNLKPPSPKLWNEKIPPELEAVVLKCLAKNPKDRFQNVLELLNAFEMALDGRQIELVENSQLIIEETTKDELSQIESKKEIESEPVEIAKNEEKIEEPPKKIKRKDKKTTYLWGGLTFIAVIMIALFAFIGQGGGAPTEQNEFENFPVVKLIETETDEPKIVVQPTKTLTATIEPTIQIIRAETRTLVPTDTATLEPVETATEMPCSHVDLTGEWTGYSKGTYHGRGKPSGININWEVSILQIGCKVYTFSNNNDKPFPFIDVYDDSATIDGDILRNGFVTLDLLITESELEWYQDSDHFLIMHKVSGVPEVPFTATLEKIYYSISITRGFGGDSKPPVRSINFLNPDDMLLRDYILIGGEPILLPDETTLEGIIYLFEGNYILEVARSFYNESFQCEIYIDGNVNWLITVTDPEKICASFP